MWKTLKLSSGRFEVYKEENGNTVMVYPETFGTPEEAAAKIARLTDGIEAEPVDGVAQRPPVADKPVDSVQAPVPVPTNLPVGFTAPAGAEINQGNGDYQVPVTGSPIPPPVAEPSADADASKSESASEASAEGSASSADAGATV